MAIEYKPKSAQEIEYEEYKKQRDQKRRERQEAAERLLARPQTPLQSTLDARDYYPSEPELKPAKALKPKGAKLKTKETDKIVKSGETKSVTVRLDKAYIDIAHQKGEKMTDVINEAMSQFYRLMGWL